uniref:Ig-like domain-containing protein n=1 Tax=Haemonchus contortus TaxID=6289 RepID=A0A7I4XST4_HAECO
CCSVSTVHQTTLDFLPDAPTCSRGGMVKRRSACSLGSRQKRLRVAQPSVPLKKLFLKHSLQIGNFAVYRCVKSATVGAKEGGTRKWCIGRRALYGLSGLILTTNAQ